MQFLLLYFKENMATDTPGYLTAPGESEYDYTNIQENNSSDGSAAGLNKRQTCNKLQIFMAAGDFFLTQKEKENVLHIK
jgi:hypothetical protein